MAYYTRPDFSRQIKQYSGTTAILSGKTNILEKFSVKNIEIDTAGALDGNALLYDSANNKFVPAVIGAFGSGIVQGLILTYDSGLTYNISSGSFRIGPTLYEGYLGGSVTIASGQTGGSRFDVVYITSAVTAYVKSGITATNPSIPALSGGELQIGIIFVPVNFTGGTGTTVIQTTADTVFEYYNAGTGIQRSPDTTNAEAPGAFSFALANNSKAYGEHSSALGYHSKASGYSQTVVGPYNLPNTDDYFIVGNGTNDGSRSNAFRITTGGSAYIQNKLFVSNGIEIEVTGATTNGQALMWDGTKFKPQTITGATGGSGLTSGTSLGDGVKILFSSDTTSLSFATLSSQTPSTLRIVSSSTGVILFSATTGSQGISGTYVSGLTSAGTGNYSIISSITNNQLIYRTISAGTNIGITENNGTLIISGSGGITGNFVPLTGTTSGSPMQGNLVFSGTNGIIVDDGTTFANSLTSTGLTLGASGNKINISPTFVNSAPSTSIQIPDTATGSGYIATVPNIAGQANKFIKVKSNELGFDYSDYKVYEYINLADAQIATGLTLGQWYRIPVSSRSISESVNFNTYGDVVLLAVETNKFSPDGYLLAINADYNGVGDYSDAIINYGGTGNNLGVAYANIIVNNLFDIVIYNNRHYIADSIPFTPFTVVNQNDLNYFTPIPKDYTTLNGYNIEAQKIIYDVSNDTIKRMEDKRGNVFVNNNNIEYFRFGDNNIYNNQVNTFDVFNILNYRNLSFLGNIVNLGTIPTPADLTSIGVTLGITYCTIQDFYFRNDYLQSLYLAQSVIQDKKILGTNRTFTITSSTITLPMLTNGQGWAYEQAINATGGTFNGIITAITQDNQITNYYQKFNFINLLSQNITFRNSSSLKTEGGLDAVLKQGDEIEFYLSGGIGYQKNINNYL